MASNIDGKRYCDECGKELDYLWYCCRSCKHKEFMKPTECQYLKSKRPNGWCKVDQKFGLPCPEFEDKFPRSDNYSDGYSYNRFAD